MMNREERRKYYKKIGKDKRLSECPKCGYKSLFYSTSIPTDNYEVKENEDGTSETVPIYTTAIKCDICGEIIYQGENVEKLCPPGIYLPLQLDIFDYALRHPELNVEPDAEKVVDRVFEFDKEE